MLARPDWAWDVGVRGRPHEHGQSRSRCSARGAALTDFMGWVGAQFRRGVTWKDVEWVRSQWDGPLVIKGILDPDDAREAAGQRRRRRSSSPTTAAGSSTARCRARARCRAIADAVAGRMPVLVDGGVRSGLDVVRMLALGADFVLLGPRLGLCAGRARARRASRTC